MKHLFLAFSLLLLAGFTTYSQSHIFLPINNQECVNCLGSTHYFGMLDSTLKPTIVFERRYRRDSASLVKRLHLEPQRYNFAWSDSLYNLFRADGALSSSVSLYNPESKRVMKTDLVHIADNLPFLNAINKSVDTISLDQPTFGGDSHFGNTGSYFFNFNGVSKELSVFDKANNKHLYTLSLTDSLVEMAFKLRFGKEWKEIYKKVQDYTSKWQTIDPQAYSNYYCSNDTVYLLAQHRYMIYPEEGAADINTTIFLSLSVYKNGKLIAFSLVENYLDPVMKGKEGGIRRITKDGKVIKGKESYYIMPGPFVFYKNELYLSLISGMAKGIPNHFLVKYNYDAPSRTYKYSSLYDKTLPDVYEPVGYNFTSPGIRIPFSAPYTALYLSDHLFSLDKNKDDILLNFFPPNNKSNEKGIWDLRVTAANAYMIYIDNDKFYHYLKYDLKAKKVLVNKAILNYKSASFVTTPMIDDFDYNYVYIPLGETNIIRSKAAN